MSTNYFNVPTYRPSTVFQPPAVTVNVPAPPTLGTLDASITGAKNAPGYARRNLLAAQLGPNGAIQTRYKGLMQARRDAAKAATRGFGGVSWVNDDPNTPDVDESLTPRYESDKMGQNERDAYNSALSRGAASGVSYSSAGDQLVGSALQRVSDEASKTIMQYAGDINNYANAQLNESNAALDSYMSLYGTDATWLLTQQQTQTAEKPDPSTGRPDQVAASGQANSPSNPFIAGQGKAVWTGKSAPSAAYVRELRSKYKAENGYFVTPVKVGKNKWVIRVQYAYDPANPASPPINTGYLDRRMG